MSVKCEEPLDELTVQVWLLYLHPNFNYWTLFVNGTELWTNRQTDKQTDGQTIQLLDAPGGPFKRSAGGIKNIVTKNTSVKYESAISNGSKVMGNGNIFRNVGQRSPSRSHSQKF